MTVLRARGSRFRMLMKPSGRTSIHFLGRRIIALLVLFLVGEILERVLGQQTVEPSNLHIRTLVAALVLNLLVVPLNSYGTCMYAYPLDTLRSKAMLNYILEWASPNFHRIHPDDGVDL